MRRVIYLGWDGSYVLSRVPLRKAWDPAGHYYLSPMGKRAKCVDIGNGVGGDLLFASLKLDMFEVVKLEIQVHRTKSKPKKVRK